MRPGGAALAGVAAAAGDPQRRALWELLRERLVGWPLRERPRGLLRERSPALSLRERRAAEGDGRGCAVPSS